MNPNFNRRQFIGLAVCVAVNTALPGCKKKEPEWTVAKDDKLKPLAFEISEGSHSFRHGLSILVTLLETGDHFTETVLSATRGARLSLHTLPDRQSPFQYRAAVDLESLNFSYPFQVE